ncbi:unnamed protein product [Closterium sp. Yama58-4]|nr:unnamed protein product [Closterium sp. Yama58-4]
MASIATSAERAVALQSHGLRSAAAAESLGSSSSHAFSQLKVTPLRAARTRSSSTRSNVATVRASSDSEYRTGVKRNHNIGKLQAGYLFPEIARRRRAHLEKHPDAKIISLGIGDTTEPIPDVITAAMAKRAQGLSTPAGYSGYGAEQGEQEGGERKRGGSYEEYGVSPVGSVTSLDAHTTEHHAHLSPCYEKLPHCGRTAPHAILHHPVPRMLTPSPTRLCARRSVRRGTASWASRRMRCSSPTAPSATSRACRWAPDTAHRFPTRQRQSLVFSHAAMPSSEFPFLYGSASLGRFHCLTVFSTPPIRSLLLNQMMFGADVTMACQDPSYPAYVDTSVMMGQTGLYVPETQQFGNVTYLRCTPENDFFPDLSSAPRTDIIFFCSPNNPTGRAASRQQLQQLVDFARANGSIIVYDCAYAIYIEDDSPKSIYEIPGADEVAIETGSFSKYAGFTGVRLGWSVVPAALRYADGHPVRADFNRVTCTCFNGASNVSQAGGLACLSPEGLEAMGTLVSFYKENAAILKSTFQSLGFETHGGDNAPYVWVRFPGRSSWDVFAEILEKADIVTTPGSGFGPGGEGFVRASAFGNRANIEEAARRITKLYSS